MSDNWQYHNLLEQSIRFRRLSHQFRRYANEHTESGNNDFALDLLQTSNELWAWAKDLLTTARRFK